MKKLETFLGNAFAFFSHLVTTVFLFDDASFAIARWFCLFHLFANAPFPPLFAREAKTLLCVIIIIDRVVSKY